MRGAWGTARGDGHSANINSNAAATPTPEIQASLRQGRALRSNSAITRLRTAVKCAAAGTSACAACKTARLSRTSDQAPDRRSTLPNAAPLPPRPRPQGPRPHAARSRVLPFHAVHDRLPKYRSTKPFTLTRALRNLRPHRGLAANPASAPLLPSRALPDRAAPAPPAPFPTACAGSTATPGCARFRPAPAADPSPPAASWPCVLHRILRPPAPPQIVAGVHRDPVEPAGHRVLRSQLSQIPVQLEEDFLGDILCVGQVAGSRSAVTSTSRSYCRISSSKAARSPARAAATASTAASVRQSCHRRQCQASHSFHQIKLPRSPETCMEISC